MIVNAIEQFARLREQGRKIRERDRANIEYMAKIPAHIKAMSDDELAALFWSDDTEWCEEIHWLLNFRGRGALCAV